MMPGLDFAVLSNKSAVKIPLYLDDSLKVLPVLYLDEIWLKGKRAIGKHEILSEF